jgi:S1-C subfamily serine protease
VPSTTIPDPYGNSDPSTGANSTPAFPSAPSTVPSTATNWDAVAQRVDQSLVDINVVLPNAIGAGTGIVLDTNGDVVTNNHVVDGATRIQVVSVTDGTEYAGTVIGTDPTHDVAVIHLAGAKGMTPAAIGDSDNVKIDDPVAGIGNAGGQGGTPSVADGSVVDLHQSITASDQDGSNPRTLNDLIQTDAGIQPGDSGGPLVNDQGEVIGIDVAASTGYGRSSSGAQEGFAIPINQAMTIAKQLEAHPSAGSSTSPAVGSGYLGVSIATGAPGSGVTVQAVQPNGPAAAAGVVAGDVITMLDGITITSNTTLQGVLAQHHGGDTVSIGWTTQGASHHANVTLASR